jgi:hypothetical protein
MLGFREHAAARLAFDRRQWRVEDLSAIDRDSPLAWPDALASAAWTVPRHCGTWTVTTTPPGQARTVTTNVTVLAAILGQNGVAM